MDRIVRWSVLVGFIVLGVAVVSMLGLALMAWLVLDGVSIWTSRFVTTIFVALSLVLLRRMMVRWNLTSASLNELRCHPIMYAIGSTTLIMVCGVAVVGICSPTIQVPLALSVVFLALVLPPHIWSQTFSSNPPSVR